MIRRVVIQERQRFLREGLAQVLGAEPDLEVVGVAADASGLVALCDERRPDVVILELDADGWDGARLAAALRRRHRMLRVVGLYRHLSSEQARRAVRAGVRATVSRGAGSMAIASAVRGRGSVSVVSPMVPVSRPRPMAPPAVTLSAREHEVLDLIGRGHTTAEIALRLQISAKTVENHKQRVYAKLGVHSQAHAVAVALRAGLLRPQLGRAAGAGAAVTGAVGEADAGAEAGAGAGA